MARIIHLSRPHPWHGIPTGRDVPRQVNAYIEITPFDTVKYESDKETGFLTVDRPQRSASLPPTLYGFIPRTYCAERVAALCPKASVGDGDPLDICVISERHITKADLLLRARPLGGFRMLDGGEADDKIIAVLDQDPVWGDAQNLPDLPSALVDRLRHYFTTYKLMPGMAATEIDLVYGRDHAEVVIAASMDDYREHFGER